jgi:hypothetical protein
LGEHRRAKKRTYIPAATVSSTPARVGGGMTALYPRLRTPSYPERTGGNCPSIRYADAPTNPREQFAMKWIKVAGQVSTVVNAAHIVRIYGSGGKFKVELINGESFDIPQAENDRLVKLLMENEK